MTQAYSQTIISPEVHADSSVTFRLYAPDAKRVQIESDCLLCKPDNSWFGGKMAKREMTKGDDGIFSFTTRPLIPEVYQYRFIVDGKKTHDPQNPDSTYVLLHQESIVAVGGTELADLYVTNVDIPHGRIDTLDYYDEPQQVSRKVLVYVPLCTQTTDSLPVLYLLHGISGDERSWTEGGRLQQIMDNMIALQKTEPMFVVMPDCNVRNKLTPKHRTNLYRNMMNYPGLQRGDFEEAFLRMHQYISENYPVATERDQHFIAGVSSGAQQAANIVSHNTDLFSVVGLFSPALMKKKHLPPADSEIKYHIYVGQNDLFYNDGIRFARHLNARNITCTMHDTEGGHTWRSWREFLTDFLTLLSR